MPTPSRNTSGAFLLLSHETSPSPPSSTGVTVCDVRPQSLTTALSDGSVRGLSGHLPQFPALLRRPSPRDLAGSTTATRPAYSGLAGRFTLAHSATGQDHLAIRVTFLHRLLEELAWNEQIPTLTHLLSREDVPRREQTLPAPVAAGTGSTDSAGTAAPRRSRQQSLAAATPHRHAHRRVRRPGRRLPASRSVRISGPSMCRSANSRPNAWFPWIPLSAKLSNACSPYARQADSAPEPSCCLGIAPAKR